MGKQNEWTHSTYQKFDALRNHLERFRDDQRKKLRNKKFELSFSYFDEEGAPQFFGVSGQGQENEEHVG